MDCGDRSEPLDAKQVSLKVGIKSKISLDPVISFDLYKHIGTYNGTLVP